MDQCHLGREKTVCCSPTQVTFHFPACGGPENDAGYVTLNPRCIAVWLNSGRNARCGCAGASGLPKFGIPFGGGGCIGGGMLGGGGGGGGGREPPVWEYGL